MNGSFYLVPSVCVAGAIATSLLLLMRAWQRHQAIQGQAHRVPIAIAICRIPAMMLAPTISALLTPALENRLTRTLDANGLYPQITPLLWVATRAVHATAAGAAILALGGRTSWALALLAWLAGFMAGGLWLRRMTLERERQIARELPAYLDLLTVCVEAGATLTAGVRLIVAQAPDTPLRSYFDRVLREVRSGRPRAEAFIHVAEIHGVESLTTLASALAHAEGAGMSLGHILRTQSEQRTAERFARAERLAMQAPVKMLGPLIFCIFPCTFIVLAVPIVVRLLEVFRS